MTRARLYVEFCLTAVDLSGIFFFFFSSRRRHTRFDCDWSSDVCSSDLVLDLGCGEGRLLSLLLADNSFTEIVGIDVSPRVLEKAAQHLRLDSLPPRKRERVKLLQGSLMYRDARLESYDAAAVVEVVEHLDPPRLAAFERVLFEHAKPITIVMTTPNREYNVKFETMAAGSFRHRDHRFEWTRQEYQSWANRVGTQHGYAVSFIPVGDVDALLGAPTQMAIFRRSNA